MTSPKKTVRAMRVQYAALPYRQKGDSSTEVLLVTSRDTGRWIIPKGWPLKGKAPHRAAAREAHEEAGVVRKINRRAIGSFFRLRSKGIRFESEGAGKKLAGKKSAQSEVVVTD
jgi:8-oxo-dGTP pyrophosphatase MutT (NUDIX family)